MMMFRHRAPDLKAATPRYSLAARLLALGEILDNHKYIENGLCILASDGGFIVTGFVPVAKGMDVTLLQQTHEITPAMIASALEAYNQSER
jgi:hypothetical protein